MQTKTPARRAGLLAFQQPLGYSYRPHPIGDKMDGVTVKEVAGTILISGIPSQPAALYLCGQFQGRGVKATVGMLPAVPGYQVTVYHLSFAEAATLLRQFGVKAES
jgi:hypothetical protein